MTVRVSGDACQVHASATTVRRLIVIAMSAPPGADARAGVATMSESAHGPVGSASTGSGGTTTSGSRFFLPFLPVLTAAVGPALGAAEDSTLAPACVAVPPAPSVASEDPPSTRASTTTSSRGTPSTMRRRVQ